MQATERSLNAVRGTLLEKAENLGISQNFVIHRLMSNVGRTWSYLLLHIWPVAQPIYDYLNFIAKEL